MQSLLRTSGLMAGVMLIPVVPFLFFGEQMETWITQWSESGPGIAASAAAVVGLLTVDIFLPIPSSVVNTFGGWQLGTLGGTLASFVGLSLGAAVGFALARWWGRPLALWFCRQEDLDRMDAMSRRYGDVVLVLTRAVPVLAESSVLLLGATQMTWRRFLPPVLLSHLGIALAYSAFGQFAEEHQWLPAALAFAVALPILLTTMTTLWLRDEPENEPHREAGENVRVDTD